MTSTPFEFLFKKVKSWLSIQVNNISKISEIIEKRQHGNADELKACLAAEGSINQTDEVMMNDCSHINLFNDS